MAIRKDVVTSQLTPIASVSTLTYSSSTFVDGVLHLGMHLKYTSSTPTGDITLQMAIVDSPSESDWVDIGSSTFTVSDYTTGFLWEILYTTAKHIRIKFDILTGSISDVTVNIYKKGSTNI